MRRPLPRTKIPIVPLGVEASKRKLFGHLDRLAGNVPKAPQIARTSGASISTAATAGSAGSPSTPSFRAARAAQERREALVGLSAAPTAEAEAIDVQETGFWERMDGLVSDMD